MSLTSCIITKRNTNRDGYGLMYFNRKQCIQHRVVYAQHNNIDLDDMKGLVVMHLCDNPSCINIDHLRLGTQQDNVDDRNNKGRQAIGVGHGSNKLTEADVLAIRGSHLLGKELAEDYGVHTSTIYQIKNGVIWKHLL